MEFLKGEDNIAKRPEVRAKISAKLKGKPFHGTRYEGRGAENGRWKGEYAGYCSKHQWISSNYGQPKHCEKCGTTEAASYGWHNNSGDYLREKSDYVRLCSKCHWKEHHPNGWIVKRNSKGQVIA